MHKLAPADTAALAGKIDGACASMEGQVRVLLTCEAGCEGSWLGGLDWPRFDVVVCDPASLEVVRRAKSAKTDRIDARRMVRALRAWDRGEVEALSRVRIPTVAEEDARRLMRRRERLVRERIRLSNTILGLLKLHGIRNLHPLKPGFGGRLGVAETANGIPLPPGARLGIEEIAERPALLGRQLKVVGRVAASGASGDPGRCSLAGLTKLKGIGPNDAVLLTAGVFHRDFRNRRELAAWAGLAPVPWASGSVQREQGISKAGNAMVRRHLIQMAWRWIRFQPDSAISLWFRDCCSTRDGRSRKRGIVAVARKLLIALWRYATTGLVPTGSVMPQ
jgi:transposase